MKWWRDNHLEGADWLPWLGDREDWLAMKIGKGFGEMKFLEKNTKIETEDAQKQVQQKRSPSTIFPVYPKVRRLPNSPPLRGGV